MSIPDSCRATSACHRCAPLLLALLVLLSMVSPVLGDEVSTGPPAYRVGDTWTRSDGVYRLTAIEKGLYVFSASPGNVVRLTKDLAIKQILRNGTVIVDFDPPPSIQWPLAVGRWGATHGWATLEPSPPNYKPGTRRTLTWRIDAHEDVKIGSEQYKAYRIRQTVEWEPRQPNTLAEVIFWYAPAPRQIVKMISGGSIASLAFESIPTATPLASPLRLVLEGMPDQSRMMSDAVQLKATATAGSGVTRLTAEVNGTVVLTRDESRAPPPTLDVTILVQLQEGKNVVIVTALDATGALQRDSREVSYERPPPSGKTSSVPSLAATTAPIAPDAPSPQAGSGKPPITPLRVVISSPQENARLERPTLSMAALAQSSKGISRAVVTLNGLEVSRFEERTPQPAISIAAPLILHDGQNMIVLAVTESDGAVHQEIRSVVYEKATPLAITVRYPADGAILAEASTVIAAQIVSSRGIDSVRVLVNGAEVHQQRPATPATSLAVATPVPLREGANAIIVTVTERDGTTREELRTVFSQPPKSIVSTPPPPQLAVRESWAVVIGVGRHEHPSIPFLRYTVPDAEAIYNVLVTEAGFRRDHVMLLSDRAERKPTLRNIKWALGTFLARSAKKEDTVLVFFAGHGAPEVDPRGIERDGLAKYLVPSDADADDLYSTGFPMDELQTIFGRIEAERVVAFLDACYSGAAGGRTFVAKKTRSSDVDDLFLERLTRSKGRVIITAARPAEVAIELPELGHGIFTHYLIRGLRGAADLNRDGIVSVQELYEYVEQQVTTKSRTVGGNQHPVMKGDFEGPVPLVKVRAP